MGASTLLLTGNIDTIAQMSCNPAIGGQAKGQMVRELDALGGEMAINTDVTGIQFRLLNESKGPAVQSPRAQCDKKAYQFRLKHTLELQPNLTVFQATVTSLIFSHGKVVGCRTNLDVEFFGTCVVITTGTFLRGLMHIGQNKNEGGRLGDFSAKTLSGSLQDAGIELFRLKTGTPPRILGRSIDFKGLQEQKGDAVPTLFAFHDTREPVDMFHVEQTGERRLGWKPGTEQVSCWITHTTAETAEIVRKNLHKSAMYSGDIVGVGPRYCPSIEDKFVRFADKPRHMLYLEPEGRNTNTISTACRPACRSISNCSSCTASPAWEMPRCSGRRTRLSTISRHPRNFIRHWNPETSRISSLPGRSTEHRDTKKRRPRESWRASTRSGRRGEKRP